MSTPICRNWCRRSSAAPLSPTISSSCTPRCRRRAPGLATGAADDPRPRWLALGGDHRLGRRGGDLVDPPQPCRNRRAGSRSTAASLKPNASSPRWRSASAPKPAAICRRRKSWRRRPSASPAPGARCGAPTYRGRTIMLVIFNLFQTIGYYGFSSWVPAL